MKRFSAILLLSAILLAGSASLSAQNTAQFGVVKADFDRLMDFIKSEVEPSVFFVRDTSDVKSYTIRTSRESFLKEAFAQLRENGYSITQYDGRYFIFRDAGFSTRLPADYFAPSARADDENLLKYATDQNRVATFQNKIYEIGDPAAVRTGKAAVKGYVTDVATGEPVVGVSVYQDNGKAYTVTDAFGFYKIMLPIGENVLGFSGYSLEDLKLNLMVYEDGGLDVQMKEKVFALTGAVITSESMSHHRTPQMGVEKVRVDVIKNVPVAFGEADALKVVMTLPGVKTAGEASTGFNVRGGSTDQNLILFNEGTIYNPSHMFGILSAFNTDVINDVELYKSSIPAEYGGRISSVLEVRSRDGNSKKVTGSLGLGLLTSRLHLEGPIIKDRTTFILGARTTYSNWMLRAMPANSSYNGGTASFQDGNIGFSHKVNENNSIHAYGYWSRDKFGFSSDTVYRFRNVNGSLKWHSNFSERHSMTATVGYDSYAYSLENSANSYEAYRLDNAVNQGFAKVGFKSVLSSDHTLGYGVNSTYYDLHPGSYGPLVGHSGEEPGEQPYYDFYPGSYNPFGEYSGVKARSLATENAFENALYASDTWKVDDRLSAEFGLRYSFFVPVKGGKLYGGPEFRISGKYSFTDLLSVKAGFNTMRQYIHMISNSINISPTDSWRLCSDKIRPQTGWQAASGFYSTVFDNKVDISLEAYYKRVQHYIDYKSGAVLVMNENLADDLIETENRAYGAELMIKKSAGKLNGWVSYTYSRSQLREMKDRGVLTINGGDWYSAPYDKPHDVKLVSNYKFTHRYSISLNLDYSTGRPVTIPVGKYDYGNGLRLVYSERNGYRIPDYFRLDLAVIIEPGHYLRQLTHMSFTLGCYNVTGRKNPYSVYYTTEGGEIKGHMLSVFATQIPYVNFNLKF